MHGVTSEDALLLISELQHFKFCRRQWSLIAVAGAWAENLYTAQGTALHERAHDPEATDARGGVVSERGVRLRSLKLGVTGAADVVELIPDAEGVALPGRAGRYRINPVEYKHGEGKSDACDRVQLCAQALCLEEMLGCRIESGDLFYAKIRRRERVAFDAALREETAQTCRAMREAFEKGEIFPPEPGAKCRGCSLRDLCAPRAAASGARYWSTVFKEEAPCEN